MGSKYRFGLGKQPGNYSSLTSLGLLQRSAYVFADKTAVIDDDMVLSHRDLYRRCRSMASALVAIGVALADEQEFITFCKARMASFKAPKRIVFGELPKTSTGKIRKNILRDTVAGERPP